MHNDKNRKIYKKKNKLDLAKVVSDLPKDVWKLPAFSFSQSKGLGRNEKTVRDALNSVGYGSSIIDITGSYGIHQSEDMVDNLKCFSVQYLSRTAGSINR